MKYILTGGGSGGHIYPLLSFAKRIIEIDKNAVFIYLGNKHKMEGKIVPRHKIKFLHVSSYPTKGTITFNNLIASIKILKGYIQTLKIIKKFKPDVCIGTGGYVSVPVMLAAINCKKTTTAIFESDNFIGKANRFLSKKVDLIFSGLFDLSNYFTNKYNYHHLGSLRMQELSKYYEEIKLKNKDIILFLGGSQGAEIINEQALLLSKHLKAKNSKFKVVLITGERYFSKVKSKLINTDNIIVEKYIEKLYKYYNRTYFAVIRPSAGILSETITFRIPVLGIPSPNVMRNHQYYNIKYLLDKKLAFHFNEKSIKNNNLIDYIYNILNNENEIILIRNNLSKLLVLDSIDNMYNLIKNKVEESKNNGK